MEKRLGLVNDTFFWKDRWMENLVLKDVYPDMYRIDSDNNYKVMDRLSNCGSDGKVEMVCG